MTQVIEALEYNDRYMINVLGEPQLGKRGLYPTISKKGNYDAVSIMVNIIAYADGKNNLVDISDKIGVPIKKIIPIIQKLRDNQLI